MGSSLPHARIFCCGARACPTAGGILVPWPEIEPVYPALQDRVFFFFLRQSLNHWTAREGSQKLFLGTGSSGSQTRALFEVHH